MKKIILLLMLGFFGPSIALAQNVSNEDPVVAAILNEAEENSQLEKLAHQLLDGIGPRLTGTPQMKNAHDWAVATYSSWGIQAELQAWGTWKGWNRGSTHIDMIHPRVQSLKGTQLAWSPNTSKKGVVGEVVVIPEIKDSASFERWLKTIKGKIVLISMPQKTGRPDYNWEEFATAASFEKMKADRATQSAAWRENMRNTGYRYTRARAKAIEAAGAAAVVSSYWSKGFGANKIFSSYTEKIPTVELSQEDYGMVYRLAEYGGQPKLKIIAQSEDLGTVPTHNTIARIEGSELPDEYVFLSAHFDSWDGGTGATDNGTGTLVMMEAMRLLKKAYPKPKRTIIVGHWEAEEQGLNGSRAFVADHPEMLPKIQALFNQDNGTGRVIQIGGSGFLDAYEYMGRWLDAVPKNIRSEISTDFPGTPSRGGTDHASFLAAGVPAFNLSALDWWYRNYTWHTNLDTYDKIVFDDLRSNAILTAILAYKASEEPTKVSNTKRIMPIDPKTGKPKPWPSTRQPRRTGE